MKNVFEIDVERLRKDPEVADIFKENPELLIPVRSTQGSAGYDLINPFKGERKLLFPNRVYLIDSFVKLNIPEGYVAKMYIRSSLGIKRGLSLANNVGIIDSDFLQSIKIPLILNGVDVNFYNVYDIENWAHDIDIRPEESVIKEGERIAQLVFMKYETVEGDVVSEKRTGGIGSTGK